MGLSIVIPLQDRLTVEDIRELRELVEELGGLGLHFPPVVVDHSFAELTTAGVGEVDLDATEHELAAADERIRVLEELGMDPVRELPTGRPLAPIDQDGARVDAPAPTPADPAELRLVRERAELVGLDRFEIRPEGFRDHAEEIGFHRALHLVYAASSPIPGRDGWRRTPDGREWYSDAWLGAIA